jgi:hypothetical protein
MNGRHHHIEIKRIIHVVIYGLLLTFPLAVVLWLNPQLNAATHRYILGGFVFVFLIIDYFFSQLLGIYSGVTRSPILSLSELQRLQEQLRAIRRRLKTAWLLGVAARLAQSTLLALLVARPDQHLNSGLIVILSYLFCGASLAIFVYFWTSYLNAEAFRDRFEADELRELRRREALQELRKEPVNH